MARNAGHVKIGTRALMHVGSGAEEFWTCCALAGKKELRPKACVVRKKFRDPMAKSPTNSGTEKRSQL